MKKVIIKFKNSILIYGLILLLGTACVKLVEEPKDFPSPENFYGTVGQIEASLTGAMGRLYSKWGNYSYGWGPFATDHKRGTDLVLSESHGNWVWRAHYGAIAILNSVVQALNDDKLGTSASQETKDELMAQTKFLRAFNFFILVRLYGDIPLITEETDVVGGEIFRDPISVVYAQIIADLEVGIAHLPDVWADGKQGRPAKGAAKALLAKVYLTMATAPLNETSNYQKARELAADVMDDGIYSLVQDVHEVFALENKYAPEIMFSFNATEDDVATPPQIWLPGTMAFGWGDFQLDRQWADTVYPHQPRRDAYMVLEDWDGNAWYEWDATRTPHLRKFLYNSREDMEKLVSTANIPLIRYADVLLMFAEADNMVAGGPTQAAVDAVNLIIDRANEDVANPEHPRLTTGMSVTDFDMAVINERSFELFFEYDRWFDLIRKRILCDVMRPEVQVNCDDNDYLWPIPQADLRLNENLTQNPGYSSPN